MKGNYQLSIIHYPLSIVNYKLLIAFFIFPASVFSQNTSVEYLNNFSNFIVGHQTNDTELLKLQEKDWYNEHKKIVLKARSSVNSRKLEPIKNWLKKEQLISQTDTQTLFYPFSGPDFLYGNLFYPHCNTMIMVGLEKVGEIPDFISLTQAEQKAYLLAVRNSLKYINNAGYFITKYMTKDFEAKNFDGASHLLLYYLASTDHEISEYSNIYINEFGEVVEGKPYNNYCAAKGLRISYSEKANDKKRTLYYFTYDLSDKNFMYKPEFYTFLTKFGPKYAYIKSGSYLLMHNSFSVLRKLMLRQCTEIFQDDSGIPYKYFTNTNFGVNLYGTYTKTTKDFPYAFQPDLKIAIPNSPGYGNLGFTLGYNTWNKETVLMHATKGVPAKVKTGKLHRASTGSKPKFKVQVLVTENWKATGSSDFYGLENVAVYFEEGLFKYTIGIENSPVNCEKHKKAAIKAGFKNAFVVAFINGKRVSLQLARSSM